jgi:hypothetical protein
MPFPFTRLRNKARKDPLGYPYLNTLRQNILALDSIALAEHNSDGTHNALEVARTSGHFTFAAGAYTAHYFNSAFSSVATPATGVVTLTLASGSFDANMLPILSSASENGINYPVRGGVEMVSATSVKVYLQRLAALGGNSWSLEDGPFDISIWTIPATQSQTAIGVMTEWNRGDTVRGYSRWSAYPTNMGQLHYGLTQEHSAVGAHTPRIIAKDRTLVTWNGASYSIDNSAGDFASISRTSAGIVVITYSHSISNASVFVDCDYARAGGGSAEDLCVANSPDSQRTSSTVTIYLYKYDHAANTWSRADTDFFVSLHYTA